jgi:hypothetical protein
MTHNIWALAKHPGIKHLLLLLSEQLGGTAFIIEHAAPADARAVYLRHRELESVRAYIFTLGQQPGRYGVHLEYPESVVPHENVSLSTIVGMLAVHFDIAVIHSLPHDVQ